MSGITMQCKWCGRPIIGPAVYGGQAEPYHPACAQPPGWSTATVRGHPGDLPRRLREMADELDRLQSPKQE